MLVEMIYARNEKKKVIFFPPKVAKNNLTASKKASQR